MVDARRIFPIDEFFVTILRINKNSMHICEYLIIIKKLLSEIKLESLIKNNL